MEDKERNISNSQSYSEQASKAATKISKEELRRKMELMAWEDSRFHHRHGQDRKLDSDAVSKELQEKLLKSKDQTEDDFNWPRTEFFPWKDVFASMRAYPDKVFESRYSCPKCNHHLVEVYFRSPAWTWQHLMGRQGPMLICPNCCRQVAFRCEVMN